jgi:lysophospholipase L1-like esterase
MTAQAVTGTTTWQGIVVFGDSVAEGCDDPNPAGGWIGWAPRLADLVDLPRDRVRNVAMRGANLTDVARKQLPVVRHLRPSVVMVNAGMNDALHGFQLDELRQNLADILGWARSTGATTIVAAVPTAPLMERSIMSEFRRKRTYQRVREINEELRRSAREFGATYLGHDAMPSVTDPSLWSPDGIHLNSAGHAYVAAAVAHITRRALSERSITSG